MCNEQVKQSARMLQSEALVTQFGIEEWRETGSKAERQERLMIFAYFLFLHVTQHVWHF